MATTASYNFIMTRDSLIEAAYRYSGFLAEGVSPSAAQVTEAALFLNMLVKLRAADGMPVWALKRGVILPVTDVSSITTVSHIVQAGSYVETTISADEASGQTTISLTSITGLSSGDAIGVEQDDGSMHWTTINGAPAAGEAVLTVALTDEASSGNIVYAYTASSDRIPRPLRIIHANTLDVTADSGTELDLISREDYFALSNRTVEGIPNQLYYDATLGSNTADPTSATTWYGEFFIYPRFVDGNTVIEFTYQRPFQDLDAASDHFDFPQEFYLPLTIELASLLAPKFGVSTEERNSLRLEAKMYRDEALATVTPEASLFLQPEDRCGG